MDSPLPVSVFGDLLDSEQGRNAEAGQGHMITSDFKTVGPARLTLVSGGLTLVLPILLSPSGSRVFCFWIYAYPAFLIYAAHSSGDWTSPKAGIILPARLIERASTSRLPRCSLAEIADVSRAQGP